MATSERVVINPEHLEGGDGTVAMALQLWSSRNGPVKYNKWQSLYFHLCRAGYKDAEAVEAETSAEKQVRIREMYARIQEELHGPDHLAQAIKAEKAEEAASTREPGDPQVSRGSGGDAALARLIRPKERV